MLAEPVRHGGQVGVRGVQSVQGGVHLGLRRLHGFPGRAEREPGAFDPRECVGELVLRLVLGGVQLEHARPAGDPAAGLRRAEHITIGGHRHQLR